MTPLPGRRRGLEPSCQLTYRVLVSAEDLPKLQQVNREQSYSEADKGAISGVSPGKEEAIPSDRKSQSRIHSRPHSRNASYDESSPLHSGSPLSGRFGRKKVNSRSPERGPLLPLVRPIPLFPSQSHSPTPTISFSLSLCISPHPSFCTYTSLIHSHLDMLCAFFDAFFFAHLLFHALSLTHPLSVC